MEHSLKVNPDCEKLDEQRAKEFHNVVAQGSHVSQRSRADIQPATAFVCTKVSDPDEDDWKKRCRLMSHLKDTLELCPALRADQHNILAWHVDASHATHADGKDHAGATMTMGSGAACNQSTEQRLNTRSNTKSELIGADD